MKRPFETDFDLGYTAYYSQKKVWDNPYNQDTQPDRNEQWFAGWQEAWLDDK